MSAAELRQAADALLNPDRQLTDAATDALLGIFERAGILADESEHDAGVASDKASCNVEPKYSPVVRDLIGLARLINGAAA